VAYHLLQPDGTIRESVNPGRLGGNSTLRIYGRLDCARAVAALPLGYARHRVFFEDERAAILAGYRPCARCMNQEYVVWKAGPRPDSTYPWRITPHHPMETPTSLA
jgi:Metal binding domain of Ada